MTHKNAMSQLCDGTLCRLCTRCSNCRYQKPGQYKPHEHDFTIHPAGVHEPVPEPPPKKRKARPKKL